MAAATDYSTRTGGALTEARTVLSRADTALYWLRLSNDETADAIIPALEATVDALLPFAKKGWKPAAEYTYGHRP
jgi:hypothetical protein